MSNVKYSGYFNSNSGMAEAARNIVMAFHKAGSGVTTEISPNIETTKHLGEAYEFCQQQAGVNIPYQVKIIHITPDIVRKHLETMRYHIFHLFWETSKLPKWWVWELNHSVDEVWTGCEWNRQTFYNSGVNVPVWVCPQPVATFPSHVQEFQLPNRPPFLFGSVFQWIERKDPKTLITAFMDEFEGNENVGLLIKSYKEKFTSAETQEILSSIKEWKKGREYPKIYFYPSALQKSDMYRFYETINCFVSAHRGEGWGIGQAEAMSAGLPVISTNLGGIHEHVPTDLWYPVEYDMCNVFNMNWVPWYDSDQQWGQARKEHLQSQMRDVYNHYDQAQEKGTAAKAYVEEHLSYEAVGKRMNEQLEKVL